MTYDGNVTFEWDPEKDLRNRRKHGIGFADAVRIFESEAECLDLWDDSHPGGEERFITIGPLDDRLVLVVWTERDVDTVRVITARWATRGERDLYRRRMEEET